jgi:hypothetical protein
LAPVEIAISGGIPMNIRIGLIKKPPPTPNSPDRNPTDSPAPTTSGQNTVNWAIVR